MPDPALLSESITRAVVILRAGGVIVYPTETVYGIGCDPLDQRACERIQDLKGRRETKAMLLVASSRRQVEDMAGPLDPLASALADRFWPGPLTIVLKPAGTLPPHLLGPTGGGGFRVSSDPVSTALARELGRPLVSTSANKTGTQPLVTFEEACAQFERLVDLVLPPAEKLSGVPSTLVDVTSGRLVVIRQGGISHDQLSEVLT
ncbi:L-threonylcarbamoyladenylate synthase [Candidatus Latescibacterota bacterium]